MIEAETLAVDIGGTFIKYGIVAPGGTVIRHYKVPTVEAPTTEELFDYICGNIRDLGGASYIGVSSPGLIDQNFRVGSYAAPKLGTLYGANIKIEMEKRMMLPTAAINDARAAGLCELKLGRARGTRLSAFLIIGTGGGGCFCTEDDVFQGVDNFAGEFHFLSYIDEKTGEDVKTGRTIGMFGLVNRYNAKAEISRRVTLGKTIIERFLTGEDMASQIVDDWIHRVALQCLNISVLINPEIICIGGGISEEEWFIRRVIAEYEKICDSHFNGVHFLTTVIDRCTYRNDANLLGAALKANMVYGKKGHNKES